MLKNANSIVAALAALIYASASSAAEEPKWLKDARAREGKTVVAIPLRSKDAWLSAAVPAKVVGTIEKVDGSYSIELDVGGEASAYCEIYPDGFDAGATMRRMLEVTMEQLAQVQGKIEQRAIDTTDAGAIGNVPYLRFDWLYRVNDGKESRLGALKQFVLEKDGHGVYCAHVDIGYTKTFDKIMRAFATTLQAASSESGVPYYTEIQTATIGGHKFGYTVYTLTRDGDGDTEARQMSALVAAGATGATTSRDSIHKEFLHPDATMINALHIVSDNGELTTNVNLRMKDDRWIIAGDFKGKSVSETLAPDAQPVTWVGQALALRKLLTQPNPVGAVSSSAMWGVQDPTRLVVTKTKVLAKDGTHRFKAEAWVDTTKANVTLDELGMFPQIEMASGAQTITMERVYVNGTF